MKGVKRLSVVIFSALFLVLALSFVSAATYTKEYSVTSGYDKTNGGQVLSASDLGKINFSDDNRYKSGVWDTGNYIEFRFSPNIPLNAVIQQTLLIFEYNITTNINDTWFQIYKNSTGTWTIIDLPPPLANTDVTNISDLSSIVNSVQDVNNFKFWFQAIKNGTGAYTYHDWIKLNVTYFVDDEPPDTNVTYTTKDDFSDPRYCVDGKMYVNFNFNDIIVHFRSEDSESNLKNVEYARSGTGGWYLGQGFTIDVSKIDNWYTQYTDDAWTNSTYKVCGRAIDIANNQENPGGNGVSDAAEDDCCSLCVDTQEPSTGTPQALGVGDCYLGYTNKTSINFTWTYNDLGCAGVSFFDVFVEVNGINIQNLTSNTSSITVNLNNGDSARIKVRAIDKAGNIGEWSNFSNMIIIDTTNPTVTINSPAEATWFKNDFGVNETDSDTNLWKCEYKTINNGNPIINWTIINCNSILNVNIATFCPNNGNCTIYKKATDKACNFDEKSRYYYIDRTLPVTNKTVGSPRYLGFQWMGWLIDWFIKPETTITFNCSDSGIGCNKTYWTIKNSTGSIVDGGSNSTWPFTITVNKSDGVYLIEYYSVDSLDNTETKKNETDKVDTIAPITNKTVGEPKYNGTYYITNKTIITLIGNDSEVGCNSTYWRIDSIKSGSSNTCNASVDWTGTGLTDGKYTLYFYSDDKLGNKENEKNQSHYLDNTLPEIIVLNNLQDNSIIDCDKSVAINLSDRGSGVNSGKVLLKNQTTVVKERELTYFPGTTSWGANFTSLELLREGNYSFEIIAYDNVNNSAIKTINVNLPKTICVAISPNSCNVPILTGGSCSFTFYTRMRGGNGVQMSMKEFNGWTPQYLQAKIFNQTSNVDVGNVNASGDPIWNGGKLALMNSNYGSSTFGLDLKIPANVTSAYSLTGEYFLKIVSV